MEYKQYYSQSYTITNSMCELLYYKVTDGNEVTKNVSSYYIFCNGRSVLMLTYHTMKPIRGVECHN